ncbi:MAG: hypothetical protein IPP29_06460 [Bacteroidetes bacterium]|nr:hypothetical protein [Bacteroidota bacterium]
MKNWRKFIFGIIFHVGGNENGNEGKFVGIIDPISNEGIDFLNNEIINPDLSIDDYIDNRDYLDFKARGDEKLANRKDITLNHLEAVKSAMDFCLQGTLETLVLALFGVRSGC